MRESTNDDTEAVWQDTYILDAGLDAGLDLPYTCRGGICGCAPCMSRCTRCDALQPQAPPARAVVPPPVAPLQKCSGKSSKSSYRPVGTVIAEAAATALFARLPLP